MRDFARPKLLISKCIEIAHCRWNGMAIASDVVKLLRPYVDLAPVCPEMEIGLGVPRDPVRLIEEDGHTELYQPDSGRLFTGEMRDFSRGFMAELGEVDGFILKNRSPTCGLQDVPLYPGRAAKQSAIRKVRGLFADAVLNAFASHPVEDEGRLTNYNIREHFLTSVFALADWRQTKGMGSMGSIVDFQSRYKLLLMAYNQEIMRQMGRLVANHDGIPVSEVYEGYEMLLRQALARQPRFTANINVIMHALGYFDKGLSSAEKGFFLELVEDYRGGRMPLSVPLSLVRSWIVRFDEPYLASQTFFEPYPEGLVQITDSGKGRTL